MLGCRCNYPNLVIIIFFCLVNSNILLSQSPGGRVLGKVIDASTNMPLPEVNITLKNTKFGARTDSTGIFFIKGLPTGKYQIIASAVGYKTTNNNQIIVNPSSQTIVNFRLHQSTIIFPEVSISARNFKIEPLANISTRTFSQSDIKNSPGSFDDIIRTISNQPGIAQTDPVRNDLIVRGGGPSENLFLLDDIPVPNINHYGNQGSTGGPISFINLDFVKNVTFSSGGFPAQYGDKLSSVTNINFREGNNDRLSGKGLLSFSGFGITTEGPINKNSNFIFSARRSYLDVAFKMSGFIFTPEYYDLFSRINYNLKGNSSLTLMFLGTYDKVKFFERAKNQMDDNPRAIGSHQINYISSITYKQINQNNIIKLSLSRNYIHYETIPNHYFDNLSYEAENILKGNYLLKFTENDELSAGFTGKVIEFNSFVNIRNFTTTYNSELFLDSTRIQKEFYKFELYTQYNHVFGNGASVTFGIRYDYFNPIRKDYTISPRFSFTLPITRSLRLNYSTGIYYQTPSYIWLAGNSINYRLKSLRADHYILGIDYFLHESSRINVEGFYKYYRDYPTSVLRPYIILSNTGAGFSGIDDNFEGFGLEPLVSEGKGRSKGISLQVENRFSWALRYLLLNITYSNTYFRGLDKINRTGSYDQKWNINFLAEYRFYDYWGANLKFSYATGRPYTPFNELGFQEVSKYNSLRFKPQHSLDLRISRNWAFRNWKLNCYLDIKNLYNMKTISYLRWDKKLNKIADDPIMGIIPSIGIITEL